MEWLRKLSCKAPKSLVNEAKDGKPNGVIKKAMPKHKRSFAFIVGHNEKAQGSVSYDGQTEFKFNKTRALVATKILQSSYKLDAFVIFRNPGSYISQVDHVVSECKRLGVTEAIELHCNSFQGAAKGIEILISESVSDYDNKLASYLAQRLKVLYGFNLRGEAGVTEIKEGHAGHLMLHTLDQQNIFSMIVEPVFWNKETYESKLFLSNPESYSILLAQVAAKIIKGEL